MNQQTPVGETTVARHVVNQLKQWGFPFVFGIVGDSLIPLLEALRIEQEPRYIGVRHEEAGAFMASAYAKLTGRVGVCMAEAGPATLHLLSGLYDPYFDRVPVLAITGQVAEHQMGTHWPQAINPDLPYQQVEVFGHTIACPQQVPALLNTAYRKAIYRGGVARLTIPIDVQAMAVKNGVIYGQPQQTAQVARDSAAVERAAGMLGSAKRPLLFAGRGALHCGDQVLALAEALGAPVVHTVPAIGILPANNPRNLGVIGKFGTEAAADALGQADVVFIIGSTWWQPKYVPDAIFIQADAMAEHVGMTFPVDLGIVGESSQVLSELMTGIRARQQRKDWFTPDTSTTLQDSPNGQPTVLNDREGLDPRTIVDHLGDIVDPRAIVALDVGDHKYWFTSRFAVRQQRVLLSGHWRTMGFGMPAAIAAQLASPERQVVALVGDGGFSMFMAEFATAVEHNLPIKVLVFNNGVLGEEASRQVQLGVAPFGTPVPSIDFAEFARACGGEGMSVKSEEDLGRVKRVLASDRPAVIDVAVKPLVPSYPDGRGSLREYKPSLSPEDVKRVARKG